MPQKPDEVNMGSGNPAEPNLGWGNAQNMGWGNHHVNNPGLANEAQARVQELEASLADKKLKGKIDKK